jgi:hypothetical protein
MPTPVMHLALAEEILREDALSPDTRRLLIEQRGPFLLGNTAPDVQTVSGQERAETHFYHVWRPPPPDEGDRSACESLFAAHPALARTDALPPAQAAFVAGYIAHLLLDELWLKRIFRRYFLQDWGPLEERLFLHNVLRTWMDRRDQRRLNGTVATALREAEPRGWLPFVGDEPLRRWRDMLVEQFSPGHRIQTAEVFARRMGVAVQTIEHVLASPQQMEDRIFRHMARGELASFHEVSHRQSVALIEAYIGGAKDQ